MGAGGVSTGLRNRVCFMETWGVQNFAVFTSWSTRGLVRRHASPIWVLFCETAAWSPACSLRRVVLLAPRVFRLAVCGRFLLWVCAAVRAYGKSLRYWRVPKVTVTGGLARDRIQG